MARILDWTRRLEAEGSDPDPRFSFANERTFLAWIRTSLALIAAGIGVEALVTTVPEWGRRTLAGFLVLLGGVLAAFAFRRWLRRSEEHTSELQSLMRISYAVFCLKKKTNQNNNKHN